MYANTLKRLSILSIVGLCLWCTSASATLVHYWQFDNPSPLVDEGQPYTANQGGTTATWYPHAAVLADPCAGANYVVPTQVVGKFGEGYLTTTSQPPYSDILVGGPGTPSTASTIDGTLPPPPVTLSMWFYPSVVPGAGAGDLDYLFGNYAASNNNDRFYLSFYWPNPVPTPPAGRFCWSVGNTKDYGKNVPTAHSVAIGMWHHVFMVITPGAGGNTNVTLVTDGDTANPLTSTGIPYGPSPWCFDRGNKRVGTNGTSIETGKTAMGIFDDVAIFNEALPLSQAAFIYNSGAGRRANVATGRCAYDPTPADKSVGNAGVTQLKWYNAQLLGGTSSVTCDVYMSTAATDLVDACNVPTFPAAFKVASGVAGTKGNQTTITPTMPVGVDTLYWMVSTKTSVVGDPNNVNGYAGPVWKFGIANAAPQANAGADKYTYPTAGTVTLSGTVTDDGLPVGASVTCTWKQGSTPITTAVVKTGNSYACTATVAVGAAGTTTTYTLEGNDTTGTGSDTMDVKVYATPCAAAQADPSYIKNAADLNNDCFVNFKDYALVVSKWQVCTALDAICN